MSLAVVAAEDGHVSPSVAFALAALVLEGSFR
jgi:hypothetical protein